MRSMKILTKAVSVREWQKKVEPRYFRPLDESFFCYKESEENQYETVYDTDGNERSYSK